MSRAGSAKNDGDGQGKDCGSSRKAVYDLPLASAMRDVCAFACNGGANAERQSTAVAVPQRQSVHVVEYATGVGGEIEMPEACVSIRRDTDRAAQGWLARKNVRVVVIASRSAFRTSWPRMLGARRGDSSAFTTR